MTKDMTRGNPAKMILLFTLPLLLGNLFQQFYNMADTFIVGRTIGVHALAAVGSTGSVNFLILGFAMGISSGMAIVTAQRFGAGDYEGVRRSFVVSLVWGGIISVVLTPISILCAKPLLNMLNTPAEIMDDAYLYLVILFWGIAVSMFFNLVSSVMRAVGDSRTPLLFLVVACLVNIVLDYLLISGFGMGVEGAAIATVAAQLVAGILCLVYIFRRIPVLRITKRDWKMTKEDLTSHMKLGLPMGFQNSIIAIGTLILQMYLNTLGTAAVAAVTAASKIESIGSMPVSSIGVAIATFTAQNYGAGKYRRIVQGIKQCVFISLAFSVLIAIVFALFGRQLASIFIVGEDAILDMAHQFLTTIGLFMWVLAMLFMFRYALQGLGKSFVPTVAGVMELVMRGVAGMVLIPLWGFTGACFANPMAWVGAAIPLTVAFFFTMRRIIWQAESQKADPPETEPAAMPEENCVECCPVQE